MARAVTRGEKRRSRKARNARRRLAHAGRRCASQCRAALSERAEKARLAADTALFLYDQDNPLLAMGGGMHGTGHDGVVLETRAYWRKMHGGSDSGWALYRYFHRG